MLISIWRLMHFWLAVVSSLFLLIASITGAILALEPIYENQQGLKESGADNMPVSTLIENVSAKHEEILSISRDPNGFVLLQTIEAPQPFYVSPSTGEKIGEVFKTPELFEFSRALHRSLFMGQIGRFLIGLVSALMLLMSLSGFMLILKKQGGLKGYFTRVVKNDFYKDNHTRISSWLILTIIVISVTGTYLFLERFKVIPAFEVEHNIDESKFSSSPKIAVSNFAALDGVRLKELREVNFPFAEFPDEYFEFKLKDKEILVNQFSGEVISQIDYPLIKFLSELSFTLHTGEGTVLWSSALGLSSIGILFLIYSGFTIYFQRAKTKVNNPFDSQECRFVVLAGSEQGSTMRYANALHNGLLKAGQKSYLAALNDYETYDSLEHILVVTSTYGVGEAPENAKRFLSQFEEITQPIEFNYAVLGFGSKAYPDFCQFAIEVDEALEKTTSKSLLPLEKIDTADEGSFTTWVQRLSESLHISIEVDPKDLQVKKLSEHKFTVIERLDSPNVQDHTFLLKLKCASSKIKSFESGDLLSITPAGQTQERLYSIAVGKDEKTVLLSVRRHEMGVCSNYLSGLNQGDILKGSFKANPEFHFPTQAPGVILIANGTGIAPFLGMIDTKQSDVPCTLFWGGKNERSFSLYSQLVSSYQEHSKIDQCHIAFSRNGQPKQYVQDLVSQETEWVIDCLQKKYVILICGSLKMQQGVEAILDYELQKRLNTSLSYFKEEGQIKADCY